MNLYKIPCVHERCPGPAYFKRELKNWYYCKCYVCGHESIHYQNKLRAMTNWYNESVFWDSNREKKTYLVIIIEETEL
jgi:hypothetical protein